jgi:branched-chain amino acid transport system permease protein
MVAMENSVSMVFGDELKTLSDLPVGKGIGIGSALITPIQVLTILSSAVALVGLGILLNYTRLGVSLRAVADDPDLAAAVGLEPVRLTGYSFAIGSALAAIAAILSALDTGLTPSMGFNALLLAVVAVVIGGIGSIQGALVGGLAIGMVRNLTAAIIPIAWIDAVVFLFLILFLVLRPHGIMGDAPSRR